MLDPYIDSALTEDMIAERQITPPYDWEGWAETLDDIRGGEPFTWSVGQGQLTNAYLRALNEGRHADATAIRRETTA